VHVCVCIFYHLCEVIRDFSSESCLRIQSREMNIEELQVSHMHAHTHSHTKSLQLSNTACQMMVLLVGSSD